MTPVRMGDGSVWYYDTVEKSFFKYEAFGGYIPVELGKSYGNNGGTCLRDVAGYCVRGCLLNCKNKSLPEPFVEIVGTWTPPVDEQGVLDAARELRKQCSAMKFKRPTVDSEKLLDFAKGTMQKVNDGLVKASSDFLVRRILNGETRVVGDVVRGHG